MLLYWTLPLPTLLAAAHYNYLYLLPLHPLVDNLDYLTYYSEVLTSLIAVPSNFILTFLVIFILLLPFYFYNVSLFLVLALPSLYNHYLFEYLFTDSLNLNNLLSNPINIYHPPALTVVWISVLILVLSFLYLSLFYNSTFNTLALNTLQILYYLPSVLWVTVVALYLGLWWALQLNTWGSYWEWDSSEVLVLYLVLVIICLLHVSTRSASLNLSNPIITSLSIFPFAYYSYEIFLFTGFHSFFSVNSELLIVFNFFDSQLQPLGFLFFIVVSIFWSTSPNNSLVSFLGRRTLLSLPLAYALLLFESPLIFPATNLPSLLLFILCPLVLALLLQAFCFNVWQLHLCTALVLFTPSLLYITSYSVLNLEIIFDNTLYLFNCSLNNSVATGLVNTTLNFTGQIYLLLLPGLFLFGYTGLDAYYFSVLFYENSTVTLLPLQVFSVYNPFIFLPYFV